MFRQRQLLTNRQKIVRKTRQILCFIFIITILTIQITSEAIKAHTSSQEVVEVKKPNPIDVTLVDTPWRTIPKLENGSPEQNEKIAYAYKISGYDIEFIYTLNGENGEWTHDRIHPKTEGSTGTDYGFGINGYYHPQIIADPKFWNNWEWNIDRTYQLYASNTTFYGYSKKGIYF